MRRVIYTNSLSDIPNLYGYQIEETRGNAVIIHPTLYAYSQGAYEAMRCMNMSEYAKNTQYVTVR